MKATASADPKTALFLYSKPTLQMCASLKGATYVGSVTMPEDQWQRISMHCKKEAASKVADRPASRSRDELKEDLEVECAKRNGVVFE